MLISSDICLIVIPKARAKLLAVVAMVCGSIDGVVTVVLAGTVERRRAMGSIKTILDPVGTLTEERAVSRLRMAHCIV